MNGKAVFNDKFAMKTMLDYDYNTGKYESKPVKNSFVNYDLNLGAIKSLLR